MGCSTRSTARRWPPRTSRSASSAPRRPAPAASDRPTSRRRRARSSSRSCARPTPRWPRARPSTCAARRCAWCSPRAAVPSRASWRATSWPTKPRPPCSGPSSAPCVPSDLRGPVDALLNAPEPLLSLPGRERVQITETERFSAANVSLPTSLLRSVGGPRGSWRSARGADLDLARRLERAGAELEFRDDLALDVSAATEVDPWLTALVDLGRDLAVLFRAEGDLGLLGRVSECRDEPLWRPLQVAYESMRGRVPEASATLERVRAQDSGRGLPEEVLARLASLVQSLAACALSRGLLWGLRGRDPSCVFTSGPERGPLTSLIVPSFNALERTRECIQAVLRNREVGFPLEILVVDNGSTDGSREWLAEQPDVRLIENDENLGAPRARNQALAQARGEWIVFMDNDVIVTPGWLSRLRRHAGGRPLRRLRRPGLRPRGARPRGRVRRRVGRRARAPDRGREGRRLPHGAALELVLRARAARGDRGRRRLRRALLAVGLRGRRLHAALRPRGLPQPRRARHVRAAQELRRREGQAARRAAGRQLGALRREVGASPVDAESTAGWPSTSSGPGAARSCTSRCRRAKPSPARPCEIGCACCTGCERRDRVRRVETCVTSSSPDPVAAARAWRRGPSRRGGRSSSAASPMRRTPPTPRASSRPTGWAGSTRPCWLRACRTRRACARASAGSASRAPSRRRVARPTRSSTRPSRA